ncbi:MAG: translation initiation factor IF-2 [Candidatus Taylorbacteria bacterium RIFCSPHIGHO2_02_FULL_45_28]|nr:MAG: translation initiation factor IF-2 [Candidatus Taylorbacteria bacterium RIFCSPHIGHO2_01_FULL_44_110]OHA25062.1 MAG: translation initiation factor IF-2 [Candidatus Taylorbacteria bacterium RIFCSPHIGHO2_02_FULL_45_28]OHA32923.1 MAG: translation initiation factor IF-2 [Candidatus Taylorbacteria bacterium RIFCSPLOWO2_01_FULL_45_59]OHA39105.1 MAG: translation initiation factor IF-2 [Candidatus Taylorbacteria bacterium RIFCSPLOWO2_02_FULL_45_10b]OHA44124.1 MAG: translation initiation factor I
MGHIDHGKSTLLDYIRKSNIVAGEAGGITQHMGAYQVEHTSPEGKKTMLTFLDTPGHEAFCNIRERGAQVADVAILVMSAEDGVKPQTVEAYEIIKKTKIPYIVAITKIDKPNANIERAKQSLGENEIYVEGWGGDVPCVEVSALNGKGISELLDMLILMAGLADLNANPNVSATGNVVESTLDTRKGISATLLLKNGSLQTSSCVVAGNAYTPVRFIENFKGEKIKTATVSMPIRVFGWNTMPACGIGFVTVKNKKEAEKLVEEYENDLRIKNQESRMTTEKTASNVVRDDAEKTKEEDEGPMVVIVPIIIKADVIGSLDGVKHELAKIRHDRVQLKIVSEGIGDINENDVKTVLGDPTILLIGFNAAPEAQAQSMIERSAIPLSVKNFNIIYELIQYVKDALTAKIPKEYVEEITGRAKLLALFSKEKDRQVVGGKVETGSIWSGNDVRIMRRETEIGSGKIRELQQQKKRVDEVREGFEFGMMLDAKVEVVAGDRIEAVRTVEKK